MKTTTYNLATPDAIVKFSPINPKLAVAPIPLLDDHNPGSDWVDTVDLPNRPAQNRVQIISMSWSHFPCGSEGGGESQSRSQSLEPILTIGGAARMLGMSQKRFANLISEEKGRLGRMPDFVCDAGGRMRKRILRDELLEWAKAKAVRRGRPLKRTPQTGRL